MKHGWYLGMLIMIASACVTTSADPTTPIDLSPPSTATTTTTQPTLTAPLIPAPTFEEQEMVHDWVPTAVVETGQRPWGAVGWSNQVLIVSESETWTVNEVGNVDAHGEVPISYNVDRYLLPAGPWNAVAISDRGQVARFNSTGWQVVDPIPDTRWIVGSGFARGMLYVVTSADRDPDADRSNILALDIIAGTWTDLGELPIAMNVGDVTVRDDMVFILGSHKGNYNETLNEQALALIRYDPPAGTFDELPAPPIDGLAASIGSDGNELVAWNYEAEMSVLTDDGWTVPASAPLQAGECGPRSVTLADRFLANFCGQLALYSNGWVPIEYIDYNSLTAATQTRLWAVVPESGNMVVYQQPNDVRSASRSPTCDPTNRDGRPVFFADCPAWAGAPRPIYRGDYDVTLAESLEALVGGTTNSEQSRGLVAGLGDDNEVRSITFELVDGTLQFEIFSDGTPWEPPQLAESQFEIRSVTDPLYATAFSFPEVNAIDMTSHCWGDMECGQIITRTQWENSMFANYHVLFHEGCDLAEFYIQPRCRANAQEPLISATVSVDADDILNMRTGADPSAAGIGAVHPGDLVVVTRASAVAPDGGLWVLIWAPNGQPGWVNNAFLDYAYDPDESIAAAVVAFARRPSDQTFAAMPLADEVRLNLGNNHSFAISSAELRDPQAWILDVDMWRAYVGPFDLLTVAGRDENVAISLGTHDRCTGPPLDPNPLYAGLQQVSIQPAELTMQTCMQWSALDLFVNDGGQIEAIMLDIWEP